MKLFATLAAATLAAPLLATPAQASLIDDFVAARATTICWVAAGRGTLAKTMLMEVRALARKGMTYEQFQVFNEQSSRGEFVGDLVYERIESLGGCDKWMNEPAPAPRTTIPVRGGHSL